MKKSSNSVSRVFENMDAVKRFLKTSEGSNSCLEQKKVLEAAGITLGRPELEELMLVLENQDAVRRFLDTEYCEKQAATIRDLGINPDRDKLSRIMEDIKTQSSIIDKAGRYVTLNALKGDGVKLSPEATKEVASLCRELSARGLNPQSQQELVQRAIVYDNAPNVRKYCELVEHVKYHAGKCTRATRKRLGKLKYELKKAGIQNMDCRYLSHCLASFKTKAKIADKRKRAPRRNVSPAREFADQRQAQLAAEIAAEEAQAAAAELAAEKEARAKRDRLAYESINAFMAEALKTQLA